MNAATLVSVTLETTPAQPTPAAAPRPAFVSSPFIVFRHSRWDAVLVVLALGHGLLLWCCPVLPVIALGVWWNSNTVAHYFIHTPFFRSRWLNLLFSAYLSVLLGIPQALWRDRHLAHHAGAARSLHWSPQLLWESAAVAALWSLLALYAPWFFLTAYLPGLAIGLILCFLHGYFEHSRGVTSHYGRPYNWLFFNDGFHAEHHAAPGLHWTRLPARRDRSADASSWPAVFRWMDAFSLIGLEKLALRFGPIRRYMLRTHERAIRELLKGTATPRRIGIVGGALFPRSAIILGRLYPAAELVIIDKDARHIGAAAPWLPDGVILRQEWFEPNRHSGFDLLVIPLSFVGDKKAATAEADAATVLIHDWLWRRAGTSVVVSRWLLKRLNRVDKEARG